MKPGLIAFVTAALALFSRAAEPDIVLELAIGVAPDWWAFEDFSAFRGKKLTLQCGDAMPGALAAQLSALFRQSPQPVPGDDSRPSNRRNWRPTPTHACRRSAFRR